MNCRVGFSNTSNPIRRSEEEALLFPGMWLPGREYRSPATDGADRQRKEELTDPRSWRNCHVSREDLSTVRQQVLIYIHFGRMAVYIQSHSISSSGNQPMGHAQSSSDNLESQHT